MPQEQLMTTTADGEMVDLSAGLHAAFVEAMEVPAADMGLMRGELPPVEELARRSAHGAHDMLSRSTSKIAARLWRQTGRHGFRASVTRFRAAAMMALRWWAAWLEYVFAWRVRQAAEVIDAGFTLPAVLACGPPIRRAGPVGLVRCYPRTGPPLGGRCRAVLRAMGRSGP